MTKRGADMSTGERLLRLAVGAAMFQGLLLAAAYDWGRDSERRRHLEGGRGPVELVYATEPDGTDAA